MMEILGQVFMYKGQIFRTKVTQGQSTTGNTHGQATMGNTHGQSTMDREMEGVEVEDVRVLEEEDGEEEGFEIV